MIEQRDIFELTPSDYVGFVAMIADPPYGKSLDSHCKRGVHDRKTSYAILGDKDQSAGQYAIDCAREAGVPVISVFASPEKPWSGKFRNWIVWDKGGGTGFGGDTATCLRRTWELIQVENSIPMRGREESVWRVPPNNAIYRNHPCAKPVQLIKKLLHVFNVIGSVIDPFAGSGSVGVACAEMGLDYRGFEIDGSYIEAANQRILKARQEYDSRLL